MSDAAEVSNVIVASTRKRGNLLGKREGGVKNEAEVFGRGSG